MKTYCNPVDLVYRFKLKPEMTLQPCREGSDPGAVYWHGKYWCVTSKGAGVHWSDDLVTWHCVRDFVLPHEGYGPDLFVRNGKLYFDTGFTDATMFEAVDPEHGVWKPVGKMFNLCDPQFFPDDNGKLYCYYGCTPNDAIFGQEVDPETNLPLGDWIPLIFADTAKHGWERSGSSNSEDMGEIWEDVVSKTNGPDSSRKAPYPWNEGTFLIKHNGKYYLQNSAGGTQYNTYSDGISVSDSPLGPFVRQADNPFSLKPGGFITGAGHSCTMRDRFGNLFHFSTQRISRHYIFERRVGMFPAQFDENGMLYCHQRFGDYPHYVPEQKIDDCAEALFTGWMLQSYRAKVTASSWEPGFPPENAADENVRTFWAAAENDAAPVLTMDLAHETEIRSIQVNFSELNCKKYAFDGPDTVNRYLLEISADGSDWQIVADQRNNTEDKTHRYHELPAPVRARFVRLTITQAAAGGRPAVSGLRVFGSDGSAAPETPVLLSAERDAKDRTRVRLRWTMPERADGVNIRWGLTADKLFHTWQLNGTVTEFVLPSLDTAQSYKIALESFGRGGVSAVSEPLTIQ